MPDALWPTRVPGMQFRWVLDLASERRAPRCPVHLARTDPIGVCEACLGDLGWSGARCAVCGWPLHPAVERDGFDTHPNCQPLAITNQGQEHDHGRPDVCTR